MRQEFLAMPLPMPLSVPLLPIRLILRAVMAVMVAVLVGALGPLPFGMGSAEASPRIAHGKPHAKHQARHKLKPQAKKQLKQSPVKQPRAEAKPLSESARRIFEQARSRIYQIRSLTKDGNAVSATGSGFLVRGDGVIATNWHVVSPYVLDPEQYRLEALTTDGRHLPVHIIAIDALNDLALIRAPDEKGVPFAMTVTPPDQGDRGYSIGNPMGIGFTVVEGTYNGVVAQSLSHPFHFTAAINPGMSGGPAITPAGKVFGINFARLVDGSLMSFLVPASRLADLLAHVAPAQAVPQATPDDLLKEVRRGIVAAQQQVTDDILGTSPRMEWIGSLILPVEMGSASRCRGNAEDAAGHSLRSAHCLLGFWITTGDDRHRAGVVDSEYTVARNTGLDSIRFSSRLAGLYAKDRDDGGNPAVVGRYACQTSFVKLRQSTAKATLCKRPYKQFEGIVEAHLRYVTVDSSAEGLVGDLRLAGFTEENVKKLVLWHLRMAERK